MNRREFLKLFGVGTLSMLAGESVASAKGENRLMDDKNTVIDFPKERKIDFHCHAILPSYIRGMERLGIDSAAEEGYPLPKFFFSLFLCYFLFLFYFFSKKKREKESKVFKTALN